MAAEGDFSGGFRLNSKSVDDTRMARQCQLTVLIYIIFTESISVTPYCIEIDNFVISYKPQELKALNVITLHGQCHIMLNIHWQLI